MAHMGDNATGQMSIDDANEIIGLEQEHRILESHNDPIKHRFLHRKYRNCAFANHPDKARAGETPEEKLQRVLYMQHINEAHAILSDLYQSPHNAPAPENIVIDLVSSDDDSSENEDDNVDMYQEEYADDASRFSEDSDKNSEATGLDVESDHDKSDEDASFRDDGVAGHEEKRKNTALKIGLQFYRFFTGTIGKVTERTEYISGGVKYRVKSPHYDGLVTDEQFLWCGNHDLGSWVQIDGWFKASVYFAEDTNSSEPTHLIKYEDGDEEDMVDAEFKALVQAGEIVVGLRPKMKNTWQARNTTNGRRQACKKCSNCLFEDCGVCVSCQDMKKFGGPNTKKQKCVKRRCLNM